MSHLVQEVIDAHGGLSQWRRFKQISARLHQDGALWALKGHEGRLADTAVTVGLDSPWASHAPFLQEGIRSLFRPDRVTTVDAAGVPRSTLDDPRASFAGHGFDTAWSELQLAYFAGYAMWTYLNLPFALSLPGVRAEELAPHEEGNGWRRLRVSFPGSVATHSAVQILHVNTEGLMERHDYDVDIMGGIPAAHYVSGYTDVQGIKIPTKRRVYPRDAAGHKVAEPLVVSIDLFDISLT